MSKHTETPLQNRDCALHSATNGKICSLARLPEELQGKCLGNFLAMNIQITKKEHPTSFHSQDNLKENQQLQTWSQTNRTKIKPVLSCNKSAIRSKYHHYNDKYTCKPNNSETKHNTPTTCKTNEKKHHDLIIQIPHNLVSHLKHTSHLSAFFIISTTLIQIKSAQKTIHSLLIRYVTNVSILVKITETFKWNSIRKQELCEHKIRMNESS